MANNPTVGGKIVLQGEREYRDALSKINAGLKVNYAQMQLVATATADMTDETKSLQKRSEALANTIASQKDKVALLSEQVQKAAERYGEGSTKTMNYQAALLKAETQLAKMENTQAEYTKTLEQSNEKVEDNTEKVDEMFHGLGDLANAFDVKLPPAIQKFVDKLDGVNVYAAVTLSVIGGITAKLQNMTLETAKAADDLLTLSSQVGLTTDKLQEFEYASERVDVSSETLADGIKKLTNSMNIARNGNEEYEKAFKKLHVRIKDGHGVLRDTSEVFYEIIDALHKMEPGTERNALAMKILGRNAMQMNPLIDAGGKKLKELGIEAHEAGYVLDTETLQSFGNLSDANDKLDKKMQVVHNTLAQGLLPIMIKVSDFLGTIPPDVITVGLVLGGIVLVAGSLTKAIMVASTATKVMAAANLMLGSSGAVAATGLSGMLPVIIAVTAGVAALAILVASLSGNMRDIDKATNQINQVTTNVEPYIKGRNARGTPFWVGGRTMVGEEGPEIVDLPRGSRIYPHGVTPPPVAGNYMDNSKYIFKVDDINTYIQIENRYKRARQSKRMGYVGV